MYDKTRNQCSCHLNSSKALISCFKFKKFVSKSRNKEEKTRSFDLIASESLRGQNQQNGNANNSSF